MSKVYNTVDVQAEEDVEVHLWCDLCNYIMDPSSDTEVHREHGCCQECWLTFGQARKHEWEKGWRPKEETLNRYKQQRKIININIIKILGE